MTPNEVDYNIICPSCEEEIAEDEVCPECGWSEFPQEVYSLEPLETGFLLKDRYEVIERLLARETNNALLPQTDDINCYLMMDKESQCLVMVKEVAIPIEDERTTKLGDELESQTETDFVSEVEIELEEDSEIWFEEDEVEASIVEQEATDAFIPLTKGGRGLLPQMESPVELTDESFLSNSDSQQIELSGNELSTSEIDLAKGCESPDQNGLSTVKSPFERLQEERSILEELKYPTIAQILDYFEDSGRAYLVEEYFDGCTLWQAWHLSDTSITQQTDWLIQLCQALAKVHAIGVLYNAVTPHRLRVSKEDRLVLTDFSSAVKLPLEKKHQQGIDFYVASEVVLNPETVDVRADLYSLGVMWYELLLSRQLTEEDFECQFILKPLQDYIPELHPTINRLLLKLTNHNPDLRFASTDDVKGGKQPVVSLKGNLLPLRQGLTESVLVIGSQTDIGIQRETNEDNLWVQNLSYRSLDGYVPLGLFIVADGMGGAEAGEVASKIVIQTIADALLPNLIALRDCTEDDHSEDLLPEIKDAIISANQEIIAQTEKIPFWRGMGSTVTLAVIVGMRAYIGHVGDSRLYLVNKKGIHQKTTDHSIVSRLLQIGTITPEEAETHPQREVLLKAVGARRDIEPDTFSFPIEQGDTLLFCSDGLTKYQQDSEIHKIVMDASSPQQVCDSLINHTNLCGGEDNITLITIHLRSQG